MHRRHGLTRDNARVSLEGVSLPISGLKKMPGPSGRTISTAGGQMTRSYPLQRAVIVKDAQGRDTALSEAVQELIPEALRQRTGISVTRQSWTEYNVAVDITVPCGQIHERHSHVTNMAELS